MSDESMAEMMERSEAGTPSPEEQHVRNGGVVQYGGGTIMSRETYLRSIGYAADGKPLTVVAQFDQGEWWRRRDDTWARIADMSPGHRYNTAAMLMRSAGTHAFRYLLGFTREVAQHDGGEMAHDALERIAEELTQKASRDPAGWLRETTLYEALTAGLLVQGDGTKPWQKTRRDPVTGAPVEPPPPMVEVCELPACGCSGEAHA